MNPVVQIRDDGGLDQEGGSDEKWWESIYYNLKEQAAEFVGREDVGGSVGKKESRMTPKFLAQATGKRELPKTEIKKKTKTCRWSVSFSEGEEQAPTVLRINPNA